MANAKIGVTVTWEIVADYEPARFFCDGVWTNEKDAAGGGANMSVGKFTEIDSVEIVAD